MLAVTSTGLRRLERLERLERSSEGAGAIEYTIILALVALAALGAWSLLGDATRAKVECSARAIDGAGLGGSCDVVGTSGAPRDHAGGVAGRHAALGDDTGVDPDADAEGAAAALDWIEPPLGDVPLAIEDGPGDNRLLVFPPDAAYDRHGHTFGEHTQPDLSRYPERLRGIVWQNELHNARVGAWALAYEALWDTKYRSWGVPSWGDGSIEVREDGSVAVEITRPSFYVRTDESLRRAITWSVDQLRAVPASYSACESESGISAGFCLALDTGARALTGLVATAVTSVVYGVWHSPYWLGAGLEAFANGTVSVIGGAIHGVERAGGWVKHKIGGLFD